MTFDPRTVRLGTHVGSDLITAQCLLPGCHWTMNFTSGGMYLATIIEVGEQHPCRPRPCPACGHREDA